VTCLESLCIEDYVLMIRLTCLQNGPFDCSLDWGVPGMAFGFRKLLDGPRAKGLGNIPF
jgi:hypothetical protein